MYNYWPPPISAPASWEQRFCTNLLAAKPDLLLCFQVPLTALGQDDCQLAPCLICREDDLLLSAAPPSEKDPGVKDVPFLRVPEYGKISTLLALLDKAGPPRKTLPLRLIPQADCLDLESRRLLLRTPYGWAPTDYGLHLGIVRGCFRQSGQIVRRVFYTPLWEGVPDPRQEPLWQCLPLAQRLERLNRGEAGNPGYCLALAQRLAKTPLEDLLSPDKLALLKERGIQGSTLYQELAYRIHLMLQNPLERKDGQELMRALAEPFIRSARKRRK